MAPLVLYHFPPSAPSRIGLLCIRNLKLDVDVKEVDLFKKEQLNENFTKINPQHTVPTIIDSDGFILWESRAIGAYLADKNYPNGHSLYPKDVKQRAVIDQRLQFDCGTLYPRIRAICWPVLFTGETKITDEKREKLYEALGWLNTFLEGNKYVAGGTDWSLADLSLLASVATIDHIGGNLSKFKNITEWYERCKTLPGWQENDDGARGYGERIRSLLQDKL